MRAQQEGTDMNQIHLAGTKRHQVLTIFLIFFLLSCLVMQTGCSPSEKPEGLPNIEGLTYENTVELAYATQFKIHRFKDGYRFIQIADGQNVLVVPEKGEVPEKLPDNTVVVKQPLSKIYLVATSAMALFAPMNALDKVRFSPLKAEDWYVTPAKEAMEKGDMLYAGKYSAPDFEMLTAEKCDLAIESTMIFHKPEIKEKLEEIGIPVIIERSSYENHPLGRTEWIKFYAALVGCEEDADKAFEEQAGKLDQFGEREGTGKTVAYFYISSAGNAVTYKPNGYVPEMIRIAGGKYVFETMPGSDDSKLSSINMDMETFYEGAHDADIIIYNASIIKELQSMQDFLALNPVLADFKAVKDGQVWCTNKSMFQETDKVGDYMAEMNQIFTGKAGQGEDLVYIRKLQ